MQRSRVAEHEAALLLAGLALRELQPGGDSPDRGRRGPRLGLGNEAAPALGLRGKGGASGPEAGTDGLSRGERGARRPRDERAASGQPAGQPGGLRQRRRQRQRPFQRHQPGLRPAPRQFVLRPLGPASRSGAAVGGQRPLQRVQSRLPRLGRRLPRPAPARPRPRADLIPRVCRAGPLPSAFAPAAPGPRGRPERGGAAAGGVDPRAGAGAGSAHGAGFLRHLHQVWAWYLRSKASMPGHGEPVSYRLLHL
ncbi:Wilms tumor protein 1-interacting protein-like [Saccopteryx bilineata]|uniref:Wilms tumor protein 1-interacting protein-like n=1 Tax=Saccopteryx bilineata TaxID=59482 RepID=UPI00338EF16C